MTINIVIVNTIFVVMSIANYYRVFLLLLLFVIVMMNIAILIVMIVVNMIVISVAIITTIALIIVIRLPQRGMGPTGWKKGLGFRV